jgi:hypothetical protein
LLPIDVYVYVLEQCGLFKKSLIENCNFASFLFNRKARQEEKRKGPKEKNDF